MVVIGLNDLVTLEQTNSAMQHHDQKTLRSPVNLPSWMGGALSNENQYALPVGGRCQRHRSTVAIGGWGRWGRRCRSHRGVGGGWGHIDAI